MKKTLYRISLLLAAAALAQAHFVFVVPDAGASTAKVFISEDLKPTGEVDLSIISGAKLRLLDSAGHEVGLPMVKGADAYTVALSGTGTRVIHGVVDEDWPRAADPALPADALPQVTPATVRRRIHPSRSIPFKFSPGNRRIRCN
jgi:hypothetical protein